jgi:hypothetical protein
MTDHRRYQQIAAAALDFSIPPPERRRLAAHLRDCAACRAFDAGLRADADHAGSRPRTHAPDRVRHVIVTAASRPDPRPRTTWFATAAGAAIVAIALLAGLAWLNRAQVEGPAQLPDRHWSPLGEVPAFADASISDVIGTGAQLIAVGRISQGGHDVGGVWMSPDGLAWTKLSDDVTFMDAAAGLAAADQGTLVVVGGGGVSGRGPGIGTPRVWLAHAERSCDACSVPPSGNPWQVASTMFPPSGDSATGYAGIAAGGPGFVLVGTKLDHPAAGDVPIGAAVATSADGSTWVLGDPTSPELAGGAMTDVASGPSGLVAVGRTSLAPTVWTSVDGRTWTRFAPASMPATASVRSVDAGPSGFVAVGDDGGSAMAWTSTDGRSWEAAPAAASLAGARMMHVRWLGTAFVAFGALSGVDGLAWTSVDGRSWTRLDTGAIFRGVPLQAAAEIRSRPVLFGLDASGRLVGAVGDVPDRP